MTIKTAVTLGTGAAVGFLFGLTIDEDTKERIASKIKRKIFYVLTGEQMPDKHARRSKDPVLDSRITYASYNKDTEPIQSWKNLSKDILMFETREEAQEFFNNIEHMAEEYGTVSIADICELKNVPCKYIWLKYGWTYKDLKENSGIAGPEKWIEKKIFRLVLPLPKII